MHQELKPTIPEDCHTVENPFSSHIQDSNNNGHGEGEGRTEEEYAQSQITLRAIVSTKEAGVIIGKQGKNVADLRDETGVKAGVSKVVPQVHDRVLSVSGTLEGVSRAYAMVTQTLLDSPPAPPASNAEPGTHLIRLLISNNQMGTIIGRLGLKIKHIQDVSGAKMQAQKDMLYQSTERIVDVTGNSDAIRTAVWEIGKCLVDDWQRGTGTILYDPAVKAGTAGGRTHGGDRFFGGGGDRTGGGRSFARTGNGADFSDSPSYNRDRRSGSGGVGMGGDRSSSGPGGAPHLGEDGEELATQNIAIPADMVGCIIGRGGSKITEIRRSSGAKISIAKNAHDETGERMFTIMGTQSANEKALYLLYENLEAEKLRRSGEGQEEFKV